MKTFKVGSFFAGVGGICLGFLNSHTKKATYKINWANEIDEFACHTYRTNFKHPLFEGDIKTVLHPELLKNTPEEYKYFQTLHDKMFEEPIDILNGGFPCQAFSIAGEQKGFSDERGNLFLNFIDYIQQSQKIFGKKPRVLFLENVKNLKSHDHGKTYKIIKSKLEECGYTIFEKVLNTMNYSALPQNRERIYIIGFLNKTDAENFHAFDNTFLNSHEFNKTKEARENEVRRIIDYELTKKTATEFYYTKEKYPNYFINDEQDINNTKKSKINLDKQVDEFYKFYQCRRGMYVRKNKNDVCPTLTANMGTGGHNVPIIKVKDGIRKLTPAETFKLQGFPIGEGYELPKNYKGKRFSNSHLYKQAGNAVSVPVITLLATEILKILENNKYDS